MSDSAPTLLDLVAPRAEGAFERLPMLEVVLERLAKTFQSSLRRFAGDNVVVTANPATNLRFGDYLKNLPMPSLLCVIRIDGTNAPGLIAAGPEIVASAVDLLLGGRQTQAPTAAGRAVTAIERTLTERLVRLMLADLQTAFQPVVDLRFRLERIETSPRFAGITRESNGVLVSSLGLEVDGRGGKLDLVLPHASLEPLREMLRQNYPGDRFGRDPLWEQHLTEQLLVSHIQLSAILDEPTVELGSLMGWKVGSTLTLDATPTSSVKVYCGKSAVFKGSMGRHDDRVVVRIDSRIDS
jgi:flagellar motor switch protein FliM